MSSGALMEARGLVPSDGWLQPGLDLELHAGEVICVAGRDEAARAGWLRALAAVAPPAEGDLVLDGRDAWQLSRDEWHTVCQRFGFIDARTVLVSTLDGLANVMLPALYHGHGSVAEIEERALELIGRFGLATDCRRLPAYMGPDQCRRLLLARCLLLEPVALYVDDPIRLGGNGTWREIARSVDWLARERGLGLVVATRDPRFIRRHGDRIVLAGNRGVRTFAGFDEFVDAGDADDGDEIRALMEADDLEPGR